MNESEWQEVDRKAQSRKWKAFKYVMGLETLATVLGLFKFFMAEDTGMAGTATGFVVASFGAIATTMAFYFTANVVQKKQEK